MYLRTHTLLKIALLALWAACGAAPSASAAESWRIYDLRDLDALVPLPAERTAEGNGLTVASELPELGSMFGRGVLNIATSQPAPVSREARSTSRLLLDQLKEIINYNETSLTPGVYVVQAEDETHEKLAKLLEQVRALYAERYAVELICYSVATQSAPELGLPAQSDAIDSWHQIVVSRRTPTPVEAVREHAYVASLHPMLAEGVVGYSAEIRTATEGLRVSVTIGAGPETADSTSFELNGQLCWVQLDKSTGPNGTGQSATWIVSLPVITRRSICSNLEVGLSKPTVVAVVDGFEPGMARVIAVVIRKCGS